FTRRSVEELFWNAGLRVDALGRIRVGERPEPRVTEALRRGRVFAPGLHDEGDVQQFTVVARRPEPRAAPAPVAVVVLNWNQPEETLACLEALDAQTHPDVTTWVVDNGSEDGSVERIRAARPGIRVLETGRNRGYAGGNNVGLRAALEEGAELVVVLNNDARLAPDAIARLAEAADRVPDAGVLGARILRAEAPGRIRCAGFRWSPRRGFVCVGRDEVDDGFDHRAIREEDAVMGCAMALRARALRDVGLLDEDYFLQYEEIDWSWRARRRGWRTLFGGAAAAVHGEAVSCGGARAPLRAYFQERNRLLFARRHLPAEEGRRLLRRAVRELRDELLGPAGGGDAAPEGLRARARSVRRRARRPRLRARARGLWDFLRGRTGDAPASVWRMQRAWQAWRARATATPEPASSPPSSPRA
ncbi:MAG: glycosyltransferase family 2 protein, partial [Myxococcota bacterium]|nr:glycosyltransferase family 2 protein [Myxococcota bacterium]